MNATEVLRKTLDEYAAYGYCTLAQEAAETLARLERLVKADEEYDAAKAAFREKYPPATHTRRSKVINRGDPVFLRYTKAISERFAALSDVLGEEG